MNLITRRSFLSSAAAAAAQTTVPNRPNIIFVLADDLGYGDPGCYGQKKIATPRLDRMADEGIRFTQAYAGASVCAPSRCCLMTGMHTGHARVRGNHGPGGVRIPLRTEDVTVAEILKKSGYSAACIGKWGLGEAGTSGTPNSQGFDEWFGFLNQDHALEYYPTHIWHNHTETFPPGNQGAKRKQYVQDMFTERALAWIRENRSRPFFLYLAYTVPHASSELGRDTGNGFVVPTYEPYQDKPWPQPEKGYAAMVARLDTDVGRVLDELKTQGIDDNTLVIFASDNGPALDSGHTPEFFNSRAGLRGRKGDLYEGGIRVPAIARWPGTIRQNAVSHAPWAFWDFLPTAADIAGVPVPEGVDGISILRLLKDATLEKNRAFYWEQFERGALQQAVREGDWKAVRRRGKIELYHLARDPGETSDVSGSHKEIVRHLETRMEHSRVESADFPSNQR